MFEEDLDAFLQSEDFATAALWSASNGYIVGILSEGYAQSGLGPGLEATSPIFSCKSADVEGVEHGQTITIDQVAYTVRGVQPDGTGWTRLVLQRP